MIRKDISTPIHQQIFDYIHEHIISGQFAPGSRLPTEDEWCEQLKVSRYPLRQAMTTLERDGLLKRIRGKGTFVTDHVPAVSEQTGEKKIISLILPDINNEYVYDILKGFIVAASEADFAVLTGVSSADSTEQDTINRAVQAGARGIVLFPISVEIDHTILELNKKEIYISLIDCNPGLEHVDFISSDNISGGFIAARHLHTQGFRQAAFLGNTMKASSVQDRLNGFIRGLNQYHMEFLNPIVQNRTWPLPAESISEIDFSSESFFRDLDAYLSYAPFGLFCENDATALAVMDALVNKGIKIGVEIGMIGFDNISAARYANPPLTTVAQNGLLIGETAAKTAISRIVNGSRQSIHHMLPTQIIIRRSCGESVTAARPDNQSER